MVAIIQLAIASGATVGGLVFDLSGYRATFELSAAVLADDGGTRIMVERIWKKRAAEANPARP